MSKVKLRIKVSIKWFSRERLFFFRNLVKKYLSDKGIVVKALTRDGVVEETPQAYKDVDSMVNVSHDLGIATKVAKLVPIGVIKGWVKKTKNLNN